MRVRYVPGKGIIRLDQPGRARTIEIPRGNPIAKRRPTIGFRARSREVIVRTSTRTAYRRTFYQS